MKFPQNILVVVSGKRRTHIALGRVLQLAKFYDIKITLLSCIYDPGTELSPLLSNEHKTQIKQEKLQSRANYLNELKQSVEKQGVPVAISVKWHRKIQNAVMEACEEFSPDLVVKRISENASSINPFNMPVDWQLLRHCPAPLLLVKDKDWDLSAPIITAVDATTDNPKEEKFNQKIVNYAKLLSRLTDTPVHIVTTHISPKIDNAVTIPDFDLEALRTKVTQLNHKKLKLLAENKNIIDEHLHVIEGLAEDRIPQLAKDIHSQLVVMGTISRTGIKGAFMGNTAERVLTHLQCEVLALKP